MSLIISLTPPDNYQVRVVRERTIAALFEYSLHIPCYDGTPVGLPTDSWVNDGAIAIDTTNNTFYIYSTGAWRPISGLNFANADLTFDANHTHDLDEKVVEIKSGMRSFFRIDPTTNSEELFLNVINSAGDGSSAGISAQASNLFALTRLTANFNNESGLAEITMSSGTGTSQIILKSDALIQTQVGGIQSNFYPYGFNPGGSLTYSTNSVDATYSISDTDFLVLFTANTFTATLPNAADVIGRFYILKNTGAGIITIDTDGGNIDGAGSIQLASQYDYVQVMSNGTDWYIVGGNI